MRGAGKRWLLLVLLLVARYGTSQAIASTSPQESAAGEQEPAKGPQSDQSPPPKPESKERPGDRLEPGADPENRLLSPFLKHLVGDQKQFWTSPLHFQTKDLKWILPGAAVTAAFVATDSWWAKQVPVNHVETSKKFSDYSAYSFVGLSGATFLLGQMRHDDHLSEAGLLAGEAAINSTAVAFAFGEITQRQRPYQGNQHGNFFAGGSSFPSEHSALAWSIASVWAHESPGWFSQFAANSLASDRTTTLSFRSRHRQWFRVVFREAGLSSPPRSGTGRLGVGQRLR